MAVLPGESPHPSFDVMYANLERLQPILKVVIDQASEVFDRVAPVAPPLLDDTSAHLYYIATINRFNGLPAGEELHYRFEQGKLVIHKYNGPADPQWAPWMIDFFAPYEPGTRRHTQVVELPTTPQKPGFPYNIETTTIDKNTGRVLGFIGIDYSGHEPFIDEITQQLSAL